MGLHFIKAVIAVFLFVMTAAPFIGCAGSPRLPEVDLEDTDWSVRTSQVLWKPRADRPELAGELLLAKHNNGDVYISLTKSLIPIFTAQTSGRKWRIAFVEEGRTYEGKWWPPQQFIWFRLWALMDGAAAPESWHVARPDVREWLFLNDSTGEKIRVALD